MRYNNRKGDFHHEDHEGHEGFGLIISELRALRVFLRKSICKYDPDNELARGLRHTGESRYPSPSRPWMPAFAGMTNQGKTMWRGLQFHNL
jgi:hypothetical protein